MKKNERKYLVYKIVNKKNDKVYIGVHTTYDKNDSYMGSGTKIKEAIQNHGLENFEKVILHQFDNKKDMFKKEIELVNKEFIARDDTYNVILGGGNFLTTDTISVKDKDDNYFRVHKNDPRYLNGIFKAVTVGKVPVKDKNNNTIQVSVNDPRYISGELVPLPTGMMSVRDKNGNTFQVSVDDSRFKSGELIHTSKNLIVAKDSDGNILSVNKNDPRWTSGELVGIWKNRKHTKESKRKIGKANSKIQSGKGNSQYGKMWIYNTELKESKRIDKTSPIPKGWKKGRKMKF